MKRERGKERRRIEDYHCRKLCTAGGGRNLKCGGLAAVVRPAGTELSSSPAGYGCLCPFFFFCNTLPRTRVLNKTLKKGLKIGCDRSRLVFPFRYVRFTHEPLPDIFMSIASQASINSCSVISAGY